MKSPVSGPAEVGHIHSDVSGGWLRPSVFGAMDGLVTNISLVAGVGAAGATSQTVILTGTAGLVAGAFSMALGEYTSVKTQNEQVDHEVSIELRELAANPDGEERELAEMFRGLGMEPVTATSAARDIHRDLDRAKWVHITQELGVDPDEMPSPQVAAISSFVMFSFGAIIPLFPYLLGLDLLAAGLLFGGIGLFLAGALAARFTVRPWWWNALRQLLFGGVATTATYLVGLAIGVSVG